MLGGRKIAVLGGNKFRDDYSLAFDGTNDNIRISETTFDIDDNTISFVFWVKRAVTNAVHCVLGNTGEANSKHLRFTSDAKLKLENNTSDEEANISLNTDDTHWHHYVVAVSSGTVTGYQDGVAMSISGDTLSTTAVTFDTIAGQGTGGVVYEFNGNISEIATYNITLSLSQAKTLYNGREPYNHKEGIAVGNLTHWWRMGDGLENSTVSTIYDMSDNSNNGTMTNMAADDFVGDTP